MISVRKKYMQSFHFPPSKMEKCALKPKTIEMEITFPINNRDWLTIPE